MFKVIGVRNLSCVMSLASLASLQGQTVLSEYLAKHPWDAAKSGPMVVLEPESVRSKEPAKSLADFDRTLLHAGGLTVIAPSEMVLESISAIVSRYFLPTLPKRSDP